MFDHWTDDQFRTWLAGYFDGEGCIHIPKVTGIAISIASTNREVIEAIHVRTGIGTVQHVVFDRENWKDKFDWRVRRYGEANTFLNWVRPFLTIKAPKADEALAYIHQKTEPLRQLQRLHEEVVDLVAFGFPRSEIAMMYGVDRKRVDSLYRYSAGANDRRRMGALPGEMTESVQMHKKERVVVRTTFTPLQRRWNFLTPEHVRGIRLRLAAGDKAKDIAVDFGISRETVRSIARKATWASVT